MTQGNGPTTLASLFATSTLIVPSFQRAYAWEENPHLRNFVEDLCNHPGDGKSKYFFGTMLLTREKKISAPLLEGYAVVDGQQRLTTTCIFVATALEMLAGRGQSEIIDEYYELFIRKRSGTRKFRTIDDDDPFFEQMMLRNETTRPQNFDTPSQRRLLDAKVYFTKDLKRFSSEVLQRLLATLAESLILVYAVESNLEATQIFELQNDRGKRLTDLEALKSYLMHSLYLHAGADSETDLKNVQTCFSRIYRASEKIEAEYDPPSDDQLLSYHCIAFEPWKKLEDDKDGWQKPKQLVRRLLEDLPGKAKADLIKAFSCRVADTFDRALQILRARGNYEPWGDLTVLGRTAIFWPLLLKCWSFDLNPDRRDFAGVVRHMERFAFRAAVAGKRSHAAESDLRKLARDFSSDFDALAETIDGMIGGWNIPQLFPLGLGVENFYDAGSIATYLLWRYENQLRHQRGWQLPRLEWHTVIAPERAAVRWAKDHIQAKAENNPVLDRLVKWSPDDKAEPLRKFAELYLHRLGNLVLDNTALGAAKGSKDFADRIDHYLKSGLFSQQRNRYNVR
jgi:Protein of unknown function DUF262